MSRYVINGRDTSTPLLLHVARLRRRITHTHLISHGTDELLLKFRCNIFISIRVINEMPGSAPSETPVIRTPLLVEEEEAPFQNTQKCWKQKLGPENKNYRAGEDQRQSTT
jgi:hypothetical protein